MSWGKGSYGMGWIPDYPDFRDYTEETKAVKEILVGTAVASSGGGGDPFPFGNAKAEKKGTVAAARGRAKAIRMSVDLREWCSPIEDQRMLGSCTAQAGAGVIEYYERKSFGRHIDASRLFLYKVTRNLMKQKGDTGAYLRTTIGAMVLFGVPPEEYWAYTDDAIKFDAEPPAFCYAFAQNYKTIKYYRHDPPSATRREVLDRVKAHLAAGHPSMFGFTVYGSIEQAAADGRIPFPSSKERIEGGHAVVAVGYDEEMTIENKSGGGKTKGALLIRNSWGRGWGESGYGWLPYDYVLKGLAEDFWSVIKKEWVDSGAFCE